MMICKIYNVRFSWTNVRKYLLAFRIHIINFCKATCYVRNLKFVLQSFENFGSNQIRDGSIQVYPTFNKFDRE